MFPESANQVLWRATMSTCKKERLLVMMTIFVHAIAYDKSNMIIQIFQHLTLVLCVFFF